MLNCKIGKMLLPGLLFVLMSGCSSSPRIEEFAPTANSAEEVKRLATDLQTAEQAQVNVFAPTSKRQKMP